MGAYDMRAYKSYASFDASFQMRESFDASFQMRED